MKYLLDTNVCIRFLQGRLPAIREAIQSRKPYAMVICSVVRAELFYGAMKSQSPAETLAKHRQETPIGPYDLQIAAIALANDLTSVTHNTREFGRIASLPLTDWEI